MDLIAVVSHNSSLMECTNGHSLWKIHLIRRIEPKTLVFYKKVLPTKFTADSVQFFQEILIFCSHFEGQQKNMVAISNTIQIQHRLFVGLLCLYSPVIRVINAARKRLTLVSSSTVSFGV